MAKPDGMVVVRIAGESMHPTLHDGLDFLIGTDAEAFPALLRYCETKLGGPYAG